MLYSTIARIIAGFFGYTLDHLQGMVYGMIVSDAISMVIHYCKKGLFMLQKSKSVQHYLAEHKGAAHVCDLCKELG